MPPRLVLSAALALLLSAAFAPLLAPALAAAACPEGVTAPCPSGVASLVGARSLGLSAFTGVASGNDGLFVNPAATAARRRYSVQSDYAVDRSGNRNLGRYLVASVVDALSSPVAASLAWVKPLDGPESGNLFVGGLAGSLVERFYFGAQLRYYALHHDLGGGHTESVQAVTADAGFYWELADYLSLGASGFNLIPTGYEEVAPRTAGAGLAMGSDRSFKLTADWRVDFDSVRDEAGKPVTTNVYAAGLEGLLGDLVPLRAGFTRDETLGGRWWSVGAGLITASGVAIDLGYQQSLDAPDVRRIAVSFKMQFLEL